MEENELYITHYEIGDQKNIDLQSFYDCLSEDDEDVENEHLFFKTGEYYFSLYYPILHYCKFS